MTVSVSSQMLLFLISLAIGGVFGLAYDLLYFIRLLFPCGRVLAFLWDCLYLLACGVITFLFLLAGNAGEVRLFVLGGELLGLLFYRLTLGILVSRALRWFAERMRKAVSAAGKSLKRPVVRAGTKLKAAFSKKSGPKGPKVLQRCLKPMHKVMYNLSYKARRKAAKPVADKSKPFKGADR